MTSLSDSIQGVLQKNQVGDMIVARQPWSPGCEAKVLLLAPDEVVIPDSVKAESFSYFLEGDISRDIANSIPLGVLSNEELVGMLIYYAQYDGFPDWANERIRNARTR